MSLRKITVTDWIALVGAVAAFIGAFRTWAKVSGDVSESIAGVDDRIGVRVLIAAILAAVCIGGFIASRNRWFNAGALLLGLYIVSASLRSIVDTDSLYGAADDVADISVDQGRALYFVLSAGLLLVIATGVNAFKEKTQGASTATA